MAKATEERRRRYRKILNISRTRGLTHIPDEGDTATIAWHREEAAKAILRTYGSSAKERKRIVQNDNGTYSLVSSDGTVLATTVKSNINPRKNLERLRNRLNREARKRR